MISQLILVLPTIPTAAGLMSTMAVHYQSRIRLEDQETPDFIAAANNTMVAPSHNMNERSFPHGFLCRTTSSAMPSMPVCPCS